MSNFEKLMEKQLSKLYTIVSLSVPKIFTVKELASSTGVTTHTIVAHLRANFKEGVDFFQKETNGTIKIPLETAILCKEYYLAKGR